MGNTAKASENWSEIIAMKDARIAKLEALVKYYEEQFRLTKHRQFGAKSEKSEYDSAQLSIFNEAELLSDTSITEPELVEVEKHYRKRSRLTTDKLPEDLPVEIVVHELPEQERICSECGEKLHAMGRDKRRELVVIPAQVKIVEHVRRVYACRNCEKDGCCVPIVKAAVSEPVIKGSFASPETIAHIMTQKFVMGVPLYRQEQDWKRRGILLSRQTMSNWVIKATEDFLKPIYDRLKELLLAHDIIHADETTLQVLHEPGKPPQSKSYMWLYRTSGYNPQSMEVKHPIVLYEYQSDRRAKHPEAFLKDFKGYCHADGYGGYHTLPDNITIVGCWSHTRRKWDEALKALPEKDRADSNALRGKHYCDKLFEIERSLAELSPQERHIKRQELSKPLLDEFYAWIESLNAIPKTGIGKAAHYTLTQRKYLERYLLDGRLEISNNRAERSIKPFVIDRKNFLFANTPRGAKASAIMFSIIETAKECGFDPFAYLTYIFTNAPNWDIRNDPDALGRLLPYAAPERCKGRA